MVEQVGRDVLAGVVHGIVQEKAAVLLAAHSNNATVLVGHKLHSAGVHKQLGAMPDGLAYYITSVI